MNKKWFKTRMDAAAKAPKKGDLFRKETVNLNLDELEKMRMRIPEKELIPGFVVSYLDERMIKDQIRSDYRYNFDVEVTFLGMEFRPCLHLEQGEIFKCKNKRHAADLVGFINTCERLGVEWRVFI